MLISDFISRSVAERFKALIKSRRLLSGPGSKLGGNHNGPLPLPPSFLSCFSFPPLKINEILLFLLQGSECKLFWDGGAYNQVWSFSNQSGSAG